MKSIHFQIEGHLQQGGSPTPFDRNLGTKEASKAAKWMREKLDQSLRPDGTVYACQPDSAVLVGIIEHSYRFTPVQELKHQTDFKHRVPNAKWWTKMRPLLRILAMHDTSYQEEGQDLPVQQFTDNNNNFS